eukprot:gnl/TRDRNA2_/TRDRNA2_82683_c0_seq1.p1 gnl/TRDRNA2_/TRDRNA2_82683_c0~~gnl/TRDRNA2_/TRDRNA2_82683_c0_seq1.p1  ORF type:complete len:538 (+),score=65.44 gnl/TRDRNA2_/TRDRNA2_82683_c0_seq1:99-1712(+)
MSNDSPCGMSSDPITSTATDTGSIGQSLNASLPERHSKMSRIWNGYLYGQLANIVKAAVWWSMFGTVVVALLGNRLALGTCRLCFNLAVVLMFPLSSTVMTCRPIRRVLVSTTLWRAMLWSVLLPATWWLCNGKFGQLGAIERWWLMHGLVHVLLFADGALNQVGNVFDIDSGGLDILSGQYDIRMTRFLQDRFTALHVVAFDLAFVAFNPAAAYALMQFSDPLGNILPEASKSEPRSTGGMLVGFAVIFLGLSVLSAFCYFCHLPPKRQQESSIARSEALRELWGEMREGMRLHSGPLRARLLLLGLETGLEDAMVIVVATEIGLSSFVFPFDTDPVQREPAKAILYTVVVLASGKLGAFLAGLSMHQSLFADRGAGGPGRCGGLDGGSGGATYCILFGCRLLASLSVLLLPLAHGAGLVSAGETVGAALVVLSFFLFFLFSTIYKLGIQPVLPLLVPEPQQRFVFSFATQLVTVMDGLIVLLMAWIFDFMGIARLTHALWLVAGIYALHGVLTVVLAPCIVRPLIRELPMREMAS